MALVDIVFPMHNQIEMSKKCLESLRMNAGTDDYRMIFIDNGSTDGTEEWLRAEDPREPDNLYHRFETNQYVTAAWNKGLELSSAPYVVIVNNDLLFSPGWILRLVQPLSAFPTRVLMSVPLVYNESDDFMADIEHLAALKGFQGPGQRDPIFTRMMGNCFMISRKTIEKIGLFDDRFRIYWLDVDYWKRIQEASWNWEGVALAVNAAVYHYGSKTLVTVPDRERICEEDRHEFLVKWAGR